MKTLSLFILAALFTALIGGGSALADADLPNAPLGTGFTYQGQLKDSNGNLISSTCNFRFGLWDAASGGNQVGGYSDVNSIAVAQGMFTVLVNNASEFGANAFNGSNARWLQIAVKCTGDADYTTLSPRQALTPSPYALYAPAAGGVPWSGISGLPAGFADNVDNDTTYNAGTGLLLSSGAFSLQSAYRLPQGCPSGQGTEWNGSAWACMAYATSGHNHWGESWSGSSTALTLGGAQTALLINALNTGVSSVVSIPGSVSVLGVTTAASGASYGVKGQTYSPNGAGVFGRSESFYAPGVYGEAEGVGMYGYATHASQKTVGVAGQSLSPKGSGVVGQAVMTGTVGIATYTGSDAPSYGVYGSSTSVFGGGVYGVNTWDEGPVDPYWGNNGLGVYGFSKRGPGVYGSSDGMFGYGGYFKNNSGGVALEARSSIAPGIAIIGRGVLTGTVGIASYYGSAAPSYGIYGYSVSKYGSGVYGVNMYDLWGGNGVYGYSYTGKGVRGEASASTGYGGFFQNLGGGAALAARSETSNDIFQVYNGPSDVVFRVNGLGNVQADGGYHCGNNIDDGAGTLDENEIAPCLFDSSPADFAEMLPAAPTLEAGDLLVIGADGSLWLTTQAYQASVAGVYSTRPSYIGNGAMWGKDGYAPLAIVGVAPVKVSGENGPIQPGDLLTSSNTPGHAMKASPITIHGVTFYPSGVLVGKALQGFTGDRGVILILIMLQ